MRPILLEPFFFPITKLNKIGPKLHEALKSSIESSFSKKELQFVDLLHFIPTRIIWRQKKSDLSSLNENEIVTIEVTVNRHYIPLKSHKRMPYRIKCNNATGTIFLVFFHLYDKILPKNLPIGQKIIVSGKISSYQNKFSIIHPDLITLFNEKDNPEISEFDTVYSINRNISQKILKSSIQEAIQKIPEVPEWLSPEILEKESFPSYNDGLKELHFPEGNETSLYNNPARRRLVFDELLASQLAIALTRKKTKRQSCDIVFSENSQFVEKTIKNLPFSLTNSQKQAFSEIETDLSSGKRMLRLLQGDVGSGKTVVALLVLLKIIEGKGQASLMVPTEILANQHFHFMQPYFEKLNLKIGLLTNATSKKQRESLFQELQTGEINLLIGTHAIIEEKVQFKNLSLAIIDEQHRFGVEQRLSLTNKGKATHLLVMTATPIPRTLAMAYFGDMDITNILEKPKNRKITKTASFPIERIEELLFRLKEALRNGEKIYWICPLIEESKILELTPALERFDFLKKTFGDDVGLIHGRMSNAEKNEIMQSFKNNEFHILVATTVIEVGIDIKDASVMIIEHAERFGLAQLHQLRGRVGRGDKDSSCLLLYRQPLSQIAKKRIDIMRKSNDGFFIADADLKLRKEGDLLGIKQSGIPQFKFALLELHGNLLEEARNEARRIVENDPDLESPQGKALRFLLYLFEKEEAIKLLNAG